MMEDSYLTDDDEQGFDYREDSITKMGETSIKYSTDPCTIFGSGLTAIVYRGYHFGINKPAAVKFVKRQYLRVESEQVNELNIWSKIDQNINIVQLYDSYQDPKKGLFLAMEKAERTFTKQIIRCTPSKNDVITWLYQISKAVQYLHGKGIIHRDIKPDNILMFLKDENNVIAKLADFGVSKIISSMERSGTFSNASGTLLWMAPEALENKDRKFKNTKMLDIFALGMTMYFGLSWGLHPFASRYGCNELTTVFSEMTKPDLNPNKLSLDHHAANHLLLAMLQRDSEKRPNISDVLTHCLFWNWEQEFQFLIRVAICLSNEDCMNIRILKDIINYEYKKHFSALNPGKSFNWIEVAKANSFDIVNLLFTSKRNRKFTSEYGNGESVTKFIKLFRDKYVHFPDMKREAAFIFGDNDGSFCEEKYVKILTSLCPGLSSVLYQTVSLLTHVKDLLPLSKKYFRTNFCNDDNENEFVAEMGPLMELKDDLLGFNLNSRRNWDLGYESNGSVIWEHGEDFRNSEEEELVEKCVKEYFQEIWNEKQLSAYLELY